MWASDNLAAVLGVDYEIAQIERLRIFMHNHPEWRITHDRDYDVWRAFRLMDGGSEDIVRYGLSELLDRLEEVHAAG